MQVTAGLAELGGIPPPMEGIRPLATSIRPSVSGRNRFPSEAIAAHRLAPERVVWSDRAGFPPGTGLVRRSRYWDLERTCQVQAGRRLRRAKSRRDRRCGLSGLECGGWPIAGLRIQAVGVLMNPIHIALRRPYTVIVAILGIVLGSIFAILRMPIDIFPNLNLPVIYVIQAYGGMDPSQMEGLITNYYEYHFLYISGIHHVESRNIQSSALMKLYFHPGTDMAQAMAETIAYVNRSRSFMPPGTVPPDVVRFDTGSVPVGYLVLSSETRSIGEIQDLALFRVRPIFASLPGVSAPPPFGGNQRTLVVRVDPDRLRSYNLSPDDVVTALKAGNSISPSGNARIKNQMPIVPVNSMVRAVGELGSIPLRLGEKVYLRDIATIEDGTDIPSGHTLLNGRRRSLCWSPNEPTRQPSLSSTRSRRPFPQRRPSCRKISTCALSSTSPST